MTIHGSPSPAEAKEWGLIPGSEKAKESKSHLSISFDGMTFDKVNAVPIPDEAEFLKARDDYFNK